MNWLSPLMGRTPAVNEAIAKQKSAADAISAQQKYRMREDLLRLRWALDDATNITLYNREQLHRIFREVDKDPHLTSQWGTRVLKTTQKGFKIVSIADETVEDKMATEVLSRLWFYDLIGLILDSKKWGFSLIEFGPVVDGELCSYRMANGLICDPVTLIERDNVKPEFGYIGADPSSASGVAFDNGAFADQLLFVGKRGGNTQSFGILEKVVKYILFKDNCVENWSEWAEVFGHDMRIGKTTAQGSARATFLKTLKDIGSSGYGVIDADDVVEFIGSKRTDAYQVYERFIALADSSTSKCVFGQDVISNNTGHVIGEVGENVSNLYGDDDALFVRLVMNTYVLQKLTRRGLYNFNGKKFIWDTSEKISLKDNAVIDKSISEMGWRPTAKYITEKYGTEVDPEPTNKPVEMDPNGDKPGQKPGKGKPGAKDKEAGKVTAAKALHELYAARDAGSME